MSFSDDIENELETVKANGGFLTADECRVICERQSISLENLMIKLLPIAAKFSHAPISNFQVGAVAMGKRQDEHGFASLYLGANFEYANLALCFSVHAEQAAVSNAWLNGEENIEALATSAAPCGHCRQFLYEAAGDTPLPILTPAPENASDLFDEIDLRELLPDAFGPIDLGCNCRFMEPVSIDRELVVNDTYSNSKTDSDTQLFDQAILSARQSYAPYTSNFVGCALQLRDGTIYRGRYAENAAHNPSLSAFSAAICQMIIGQGKFKAELIEKVILVEHSILTSQKDVTKLLLYSINRNVSLEYYAVSIIE